ncbi:hypothetical protein K502DRAFT_368359 [Neoconidiobolus thromboides FSU 785]|nr:hypothetical protein K502DRAFT_368359 [Neoconidiobolus thromboides FSU 785]
MLILIHCTGSGRFDRIESYLIALILLTVGLLLSLLAQTITLLLVGYLLTAMGKTGCGIFKRILIVDLPLLANQDNILALDNLSSFINFWVGTLIASLIDETIDWRRWEYGISMKLVTHTHLSSISDAAIVTTRVIFGIGSDVIDSIISINSQGSLSMKYISTTQVLPRYLGKNIKEKFDVNLALDDFRYA